MASLIEIKKAEEAELRKENKSILDAVETAGSFTEAQRSRLGEIESSLVDLTADIDLLQKARERVVTAPSLPAGAGNIDPMALGFTNLHRPLGTMADQVLADPEFASWMKRAGRTGRVESPSVQFEGSLLRPQATIITGGSSTSGGAFIINDRTSIYDNAAMRRPRLRDIVTVGGTESDTVEFVRVTTVTNAAAGMLEADNSSDDDTTGLKPESAIAFEVVQPGVKTIAHWVPVTNNALADARQLRTIIDDFLRTGVALALETQMIGGNGTSELAGLDGTANTQDQAWDTDVLTTTRRAQGKVESGATADDAESEPTAYGFHPLDWVDIDLALTLEGGGTNNRQASAQSPRILWGLPVVTSKAFTQGSGWVGDWRYAVLWDREQTIIRVGQPDKFFLKNMNAVLAEARAALGIIRPAAFCEIDLSAS